MIAVNRFERNITKQNMMQDLSNNLSTSLGKGDILQLIGGLANVIGDPLGFYGQLISLIEDEQDSREQQQLQQQMQDQIAQLQMLFEQQQQEHQQKEDDIQSLMDQINQMQQQQNNQQIDQINLFHSTNQTNLPANNITYEKQDTDMNQIIEELQRQMKITQQNQEDQLKLLRELLKEFKNGKD